ncbi:hypothetical protein M0R04_08530 [Candidatus Dojkabacteria bacterium]|jgi:replicative DNA helicase|nr:hypothetical protein [Candidatus Dojkabacteria bacterium]
MQEKQIPHNIDAEEYVIGALLLDSSQYNNITLVPSDFFHDRMKFCFTSCKALIDRGVEIDQGTLADELNLQGKLETVGGNAFLSHLISNCPTALDCDYYADIVKRCSVYRSLIDVANQISQLGYEQNPDITESLTKADGLLANLRKQGVSTSVVTPEERGDMALKRYQMLYQNDSGVALSTGLVDLDNELGGGLYNGEMVIVGARPGMGKTSFLMTIANNVSNIGNVLFCSGEMSVEAITDRDIAGFVGQPINVIRRGGYDDKDMFDKIIIGGVELIKRRKLYIYHEIPLTVAKIMQAGINLQLRGGLSLIVIDYLGLLDDNYGNSQYERIGYVSRKLKQLSMKLDVPILVAHQLNRDLEKRDDKRPNLSDLRDSGRIEEDADMVIFIYRDSYYTNTPSMVTELDIAKQRQGDTCVVRVVYDKTHQKYVDMYKGAE